MRGAGKLELFPWHLDSCLRAILEFREAHQRWPDPELRLILNWDIAFDEHRPWVKEDRHAAALKLTRSDDGSIERHEGMALIRRGVLQEIASILVDQLTQQRAGEDEIFSGLRFIESATKKSKANFRKGPKSARPQKVKPQRSAKKIVL